MFVFIITRIYDMSITIIQFSIKFFSFYQQQIFPIHLFFVCFCVKKDPKLALRISFDSHGITLAFLISVLASVAGYYICKWLDGDE